MSVRLRTKIQGLPWSPSLKTPRSSPNAYAREDTNAGSIGELVKGKELSPKDIEAVFDGKTTLGIGQTGYALVLPAWKGLTPHVQEVIRSTLLQAKAVKAGG